MKRQSKTWQEEHKNGIPPHRKKRILISDGEIGGEGKTLLEKVAHDEKIKK